MCIRTAAIQLHKADRVTRTHAHAHIDSDSRTSIGWRAHAQEALEQGNLFTRWARRQMCRKRRHLTDLYSLTSTVQLKFGEFLLILRAFFPPEKKASVASN